MKKPAICLIPNIHTVFLLTCFLVLFNKISTSQFSQYNYTFDVPTTELKNLSKSQDSIQVYEGELLKEFLIRQPKQMGHVFQVQISTKSNDSFSKVLADNKIQQVKDPELEGLWFQSFKWPIKKSTLLYTLQKSPISNSSQSVDQIISASASSSLVNENNSFLSPVFPLYVLLSSGKIQTLLKEFQMLQVQKEFSFDVKGDSQNRMSQIQWEDAYIYHKNGMLYLWLDQNLYFAIFTQIDQGDKVSRTYTLNVVNVSNVQEVVEDNNDLYVFSNQACYKIHQKRTQIVLTYESIQNALSIKQRNFVDFAVSNKNIYILDQNIGVIKFSSSNESSLLKIQHPELSKKINVLNNMILVIYVVGSEQFIQQYHFVPQGRALVINKVYSHHSQEKVRDILLYQDYMIVNRGTQLILGMHSLNRNLPSNFHQQAESIESVTFLDEIYDIRSVGQSFLSRTPIYLVVGSKNMELVIFEPHTGFQIQQKWIKIGSQKTGVFDFQVKYTGTCELSQFYPSEFCSMTNNIRLVIVDSVYELIISWWIWVLCSCGSIAVILIILIVCCKYFGKKQQEFESLASQRKTINNVSTIAVQMTPEKDNEQITEATE